jgi:peptidoglycan/xylan/chitin deacetylase (PgdA/CDA1 family)
MTTYKNKTPSPLTARAIRAIGDGIAQRKKSAGRLCIINYHRILNEPDPMLDAEPTRETFRWQMQLLAECFNVLPLDQGMAALASGAVPPRAACITFDDGYRSTHDLALPILSEFGLPATVFVTTGYVGSGNMWNERIFDAIRTLPYGTLDLRDAGVGIQSIRNLDDRKRALHEVTEIAKYLPPEQRLSLTQRLEAMAGGAGTEGLMLTPDMLRAMARQNIEIGGHTVSHPILRSLEDDVARYEIEQCKRDLELLTGRPIRYFAYPNGKPGLDFDERHSDMAKEAGYEAAFTTVVGAATASDNRFMIPRSRPWDTTPMLYVLRLLRWLAY